MNIKISGAVVRGKIFKKNNLMKKGLALFKQFRIIYAETDTTQNVIVKAHLGFQLR